eukprot:15464442-Alexandrium_andersonii.AAC.1
MLRFAGKQKAQPLLFSLHPSEVRVTQGVAKGGLKFVPIADLKGIQKRPCATAVKATARGGSDK